MWKKHLVFTCVILQHYKLISYLLKNICLSKILTLEAPIPQNGQTHSNNSSAILPTNCLSVFDHFVKLTQIRLISDEKFGEDSWLVEDYGHTCWMSNRKLGDINIYVSISWHQPSVQCCISYINQSFDLQSKSVDWFLYEMQH